MAKDLERKPSERRPAAGRIERLPHRRASDLFSPIFSPWIENFFAPLDDWFDDFFVSRPLDMRRSSVRPDLNIEETEREYVITVDLPGVAKEDISVDASGNHITLSATRHWENKGPRHEEGHQTYHQTLTLPTGVESEKIAADYEDGVLTISVPKGEALKTRHIEIGEERSRPT